MSEIEKKTRAVREAKDKLDILTKRQFHGLSFEGEYSRLNLWAGLNDSQKERLKKLVQDFASETQAELEGMLK